ncbi:SpoIIE family protein phosphatase [Actinosynnema sp. NPDC020468]|uniref:SpoIIE family protein phosphatase n=1 Tax=Actinosynnema sp. NPDC020468 TaxID=3154488 RepID=UPI0033DB9361
MDGGVVHVAVFDAMGHDLYAGLTTSLARAATRNAHRAGGDGRLGERHHHLPATNGLGPFTTAFLTQLDLDSGELE